MSALIDTRNAAMEAALRFAALGDKPDIATLIANATKIHTFLDNSAPAPVTSTPGKEPAKPAAVKPAAPAATKPAAPAAAKPAAVKPTAAKPATAKPAPAQEPAGEEAAAAALLGEDEPTPETDAPAIDKKAISAIIAKLIQANLRSKAVAVLAEYGADSTSSLAEEHYPEAYGKLEGILLEG